MSTAAVHERQFYAQSIGATVRMTVDGTSHAADGAGGNPSPLVLGARYAVCCPEASVYIRQGGAGVAATSSDSLLERSRFRIVTVDDLASNRIAVRTATGVGGYLYLTRIDDLAGSPAAQKVLFFKSFLGSRVDVAAGAVSASSAALVHAGRYLVYCPEIDPTGIAAQQGDDVWIRQGAAGITVSDSPGADLGMPLAKGVAWIVNVDDATNDTIAVRSATGGNGSSLFIVRVDAV